MLRDGDATELVVGHARSSQLAKCTPLGRESGVRKRWSGAEGSRPRAEHVDGRVRPFPDSATLRCDRRLGSGGNRDARRNLQPTRRARY